MIPSNLIIWLAGSFVTAIFGTRAYLNYRRLRSPLSAYFAASGLMVSAAWLLWVLPFVVFDLNDITGRQNAWAFISIGDLLMFTTLFLQSRIYWYLALQETVKFIYIAIPTAIIAVSGLVHAVYTGYTSFDLPQIIDGKAIFSTSNISHVSQLLLTVIVFFVGIELLKRAARQKDKKSKSGSIAISLLYLSVGLGGAANIIASSEATNSSPIVIVIYAIGMAAFTMIFLVFRIIELGLKRK